MTAQVPAAELSRAQLLRAPVALGAVGAGALVALHLRDPHESGSWGICPFLALTGLPCPGCGGLRAVNNLTNGDVVGALSSNAMAVALVGAGALAWLVWTWRRLRGQDVSMLPTQGRVAAAVPVVAAVLFLAFGVFRLTPWGAALQP